MLKTFIKNLKIEKKILIVTTLLLVLNQIIIGTLSYISINQMANYSLNELNKLSTESVNIGESCLKDQSEEYLKALSYSSTNLSDSLFEEISNQLKAFCNGIENLYQDKNTLNGNVLPLPELSNACDPHNRNTANAKAFAIDNSDLKSDNLHLLSYNIPEYKTYTDKIYPTDTNIWSQLNDEQRNILLNSYSVVSKNTPPNSIKNELVLLSNLKYISEPLFKSNDSISSIYFGTENGVLYKYSCDNSNLKYDPRLRPWYISAIEAKNSGKNSSVWQSSYIAKSTGKLCITCSKAISDNNGKILGVAAIDMYLDEITQHVKNIKPGQTGYSFIIDNQGNTVIHPEYYNHLTNTASTDEKKSLVLDTQIIEKILSTKTGVLNTQINNKDYYAAYNPLSTTSWIFITLIENDEIIEPIKHIEDLIKKSTANTESTLKSDLTYIVTQFLIIFCLCIFIMYFTGLKLSKGISNPIIELSKKTEKIGNGNFSLRIPVESNDEIGQLAFSFNKMTANLEKYIQDLAKTTAEKEKIHSELRIAKKIQRSMLPCIFPAFPDRKDIDIYAIMDPAREVGGDFYDFFFLDENNLAMVIADVSDKGISAALFMVIAKILIKNELQKGNSPAKVFEVVNKSLCENNDAGMFVTCFIGIINIKTGKFVYGNAGHNPPILYKYLEKECTLISQPHGFILGAMPKMQYIQNETYLKSKDFLIFYTDGVTEATNTQGKLFSEKKLRKIILESASKNLKMEQLISKIRKEIDIFAQEANRSDDITIMGFQGFNINPLNKKENEDI